MNTVMYVFWTVKVTSLDASWFCTPSDCGCMTAGASTGTVEFAGIIESVGVLHLKLPKGVDVTSWLNEYFGESIGIVECRASVPISCQLISPS